MNVTVAEGAPGRETLNREPVNVTVTVVASARFEEAAYAVPTAVQAIAAATRAAARPPRSRALVGGTTSARDLVTTPAGRARPREIADFAAYEAAHNPDRGAGRGALYGDPQIDSDPYALTPYRGGFAVADGNDLL
jgi:hypothetical protein